MAKTVKKANHLTYSKRNKEILVTAGHGVTTETEFLKQGCFEREPGRDYTLYLPHKYRQKTKLARQHDKYVSPQCGKKKIEKFSQKYEILECKIINDVTVYGMPTSTRIIALTELGKNILVSWGLDEKDIRWGLPAQFSEEHELNITRILYKLHNEAANKLYMITYCYADRALRSEYYKQFCKLPDKHTHFYDVRVGILFNNGIKFTLPIELLNKIDDETYWKRKIYHFKHHLFIVVTNREFTNVVIRWAKELRHKHASYIAPLDDFLKLGLLGTKWTRVLGGEIENEFIIGLHN